jgi:hypothetical protein
VNAKGVKFSGRVAIKPEMRTAETPCIAIVFGIKLHIRKVLNFRQNGHELFKQNGVLKLLDQVCHAVQSKGPSIYC